MKQKFLLTLSLFILLIIGACTKMETETIEKGSGETKLEVLEQNLEHQVKSENDFIDNQTLTADIAVTVGKKDANVDKVNEKLPFKIFHKPIADIKRNSASYSLLNSKVNTAEEVDNKGKITISQQFCFDFQKLHLDLETENTKYVYEKSGQKLELIYTKLDSIKFVNHADQVLNEKITINDTVYIRHLSTLNFKIYRHETQGSKKFVEDYAVTFNTLIPENVKPEEDVFEGMTPLDGYDKLYLLKKETYRAERKIRMFYSVSGPKDTLLVYDYLIKSWTDKEQDPMIIPSIDLGNPKVTASPVDSVYTTKNSYVVTRTQTTWRNAWTNSFATNLHTISEAAKFVKAEYTIDMPKADWIITYSNFIPGSAANYSNNGKEYNRYNTKFTWNGDYNKDKSDYTIPQVFDVEKGQTVVTITSITLGNGSFVHVKDNEYKSTQAITIFYSDGKKEDTALSLTMYKSITASGEEILTLGAPMLNFSNSGLQDGEITTDTQDKFVISNHTRTYTFKHEENYQFTVTAKYQTAVWVEGAFKVEMPSSESTMSYERFKAAETYTEITKDGKNYLRYQCESKIKETYNKEEQIVSVPVKIDIEKTNKPAVKLINMVVKSSEYSKLGDDLYRGTYLVEKSFDDGSRRDTTLIYSGLRTSVILPSLITVKRSSADFSTPQITSEVKDLTSQPDGNFTVSAKQKDFDCSYGDYSHKIVTTYAVLQYSEASISITLPTPVININYISSSKGNSSPVTDAGKNYNRYPVVFNYTSNFDKFSNKEVVNLNVDVEAGQGAVTITSITKGKGTLTYIQGGQYRSDLPITVFYSDGRKEEDALSVMLIKSGEISAEQILTLASPAINYSSSKKDDAEPTSETKGDYTISSHIRTYSFMHKENYTFTITEKYQKAVCNKYEGFPIEMPSSEVTLTFSSYSYDEVATVIEKDGKKYRRFQGTTKVKEMYNKEDFILEVPVKIDVEKAEDPDVLISWEATDKKLEMISFNQYKSSFKLTKVMSKSGTTTTEVSQLLDIKLTVPMHRRLVVSSADVNFISGLSGGKQSKGSVTNGNITVTTFETAFTSSYIGFDNRYIASSQEAVYTEGEIVVAFLSSDWQMNYTNFTNTTQGVVTVEGIKYTRNNFTDNISATYYNNTNTYSASVDLDVVKKMDDNTPNGSIDVDATRKYAGVTKSWDYNNTKAIIASVIYKEGIEIYVNGALNGFYDWTQVGKPETFVDPSTNLVSAVYDRNTGKWIPSSIRTNPLNGNWDYIGNISGREVVRQVDKSLAILDLEKTPYLKYGADYIYRADGAVVIAYDNWVLELSIE